MSVGPSLKSAAMDGRFLILAFMDERKALLKSAATDGRFLNFAFMDERNN